MASRQCRSERTEVPCLAYYFSQVPAAVCYCTGRLFDELERLDTAVASRFAAW